MTRSAKLHLQVVGDDGPTVPLPRSGVLKVGSDPARCDLTLEGQGVAAVHCAIGRLKKGQGWAVKDLGSEHGTIVNGEVATSVRLAAGDTLVLGSRRLRVIDPVATEPAPTQPGPADAPRSQTTIAGYRIGRLLGRGGMGEVYAAVQESLQRPVALKVVSAKLEQDREFVDLFLAEARAAAALSHPNVVTVYDAGEQAGHHYLSMEYMEGGNLEDRIAREGSISVAETIAILTDATKGLVFAELRGIVHRDIKPANLMQDAHGNTKIADLGLATQIQAQTAREGGAKIFGTPHFISPEQARGERVDCRSDLYSLGATIYRLLSGRTPFEGQTTRDILRGHFQDRPRPLEEFVPGVPPQLGGLVSRLLEKDPADRYPSASALLLEVEGLRTAPLGVAPGAQAAGRERSPALVWVGGALGIAALATIVWVLVSDGTTAPLARERDVAATAEPEPRTPAAVAPEAGGTPPEPVPTSSPFDDDSALKVFEARAEQAYAELPTDLTQEERRLALEQLAADFAGSTAAAGWAAELRRLAEPGPGQAGQALPGPAVSGPGDELLEALAGAAGSADTPRSLAEAWPAMSAVPIPEAVAAHPAFGGRRASVFDGALKRALEDADERVRVIEADAARGDFEAVGAGLQDALAALGIPEPPPGLTADELPRLALVTARIDALRTRLDQLERERERYRLEQIHADALTLAAGFGGALGLEAELASLDLEAATRRLEALADQLVTEPARSITAEWRADLEGGRRALATVVREFDAGGWRRKQLADPRSQSRSTYETVGVDEGGVTLRIGSSAQLVPWSAFGTRPDLLHQLFHERLERDYTAGERADIAGLIRVAAVVHAARGAARLIERSEPAATDEVDLFSGFEDALVWGREAGDPTRVERELAAARTFADAVAASRDESWSMAVARLEELFDRFDDTLFVRMLADGSAWLPSPEDE